MSFPGTTAVSAATLMKLVEEILCDFHRQGKKKFLLMSGHYENTAFLSEAAYLFTEAHPDAKVVMINWFETVSYTHLDVYKRQSLATAIQRNPAKLSIPVIPSSPAQTLSGSSGLRSSESVITFVSVPSLM